MAPSPGKGRFISGMGLNGREVGESMRNAEKTGKGHWVNRDEQLGLLVL